MQAALPKFTPYQKLVVAILAFLQFTIILDFMILSPLGALLIPAFKITPGQFGLVVSAYAFAAGASGLLTAGFADRFDRKKLLLFFYIGFLGGTLCCALAPNYHSLLIARMCTGIFGGVIGSVVLAISTDLFPMEMRGRVMGIVQTALAASQVLGIPLGLYFSSLWGWHAPFLMIVIIGSLIGVIIFTKLKPVNEHLKIKSDKSPARHLIHTLTKPSYIQGFAATAFLSTGGYLLMPFSSAFLVNNVQINYDRLPLIYMVTGACSIIFGPLIGRASDSIGKFPIFVFGTVLTAGAILVFTSMGVNPLWYVIVLNVVLFTGITSRIISASALTSAVPTLADRGSYMAVSASMQQIAGGVASAAAGLVVYQTTDGKIHHFERLGFVVMGTLATTMILIYYINQYVKNKDRTLKPDSMTIAHD